MKYVYSPSNSVEAHMIVHLLAQSDIQAFIHGEALSGATGDLPLHDLIKIGVVDEDYDRAREIILEWEKQNPSESISAGERNASASMVLLAAVLGIILGALVSVQWTDIEEKFRDNEVEADTNNDGKTDIIYYYKSSKSSYAEYIRTDTNFDGKFDEITYFDEHGAITSNKQDIDYNGTLETMSRYEKGILVSSETDSDGDGKADIFWDVRLKQQKILDLKTGEAARIWYMNDFWVEAADFDADSDGFLETHETYDRLGRITKTIKSNPPADKR